MNRFNQMMDKQFQVVKIKMFMPKNMKKIKLMKNNLIAKSSKENYRLLIK